MENINRIRITDCDTGPDSKTISITDISTLWEDVWDVIAVSNQSGVVIVFEKSPI